MTFQNALTEKIAHFLREIGLEVRAGAVAEPTALPGIRIERAALVVDETTLLYPGDLLHEAGHLAVVPRLRRATFHHDVGNDGAEEMTAIAWSYAAALHLGIDPAFVFHPAGYRGGSASILENFASGHYFGVPMLAFAGMAYENARTAPTGAKSYPHMLHWLHPA